MHLKLVTYLLQTKKSPEVCRNRDISLCTLSLTFITEYPKNYNHYLVTFTKTPLQKGILPKWISFYTLVKFTYIYPYFTQVDIIFTQVLLMTSAACLLIIYSQGKKRTFSQMETLSQCSQMELKSFLPKSWIITFQLGQMVEGGLLHFNIVTIFR